MGNIATGFSNSNGVRMVACTVGISRGICLSCLCRNHIIRSVSIVTSGYAVVMIAINATGYIMIMRRQFSDSFIPSASNNKRQGMAEGYCVRYFHQNCRQQ